MEPPPGVVEDAPAAVPVAEDNAQAAAQDGVEAAAELPQDEAMTLELEHQQQAAGEELPEQQPTHNELMEEERLHGSPSGGSGGEHSSDHAWQGGSQPILELPELGQPQVGPKYKRGRGRSFFKEQPKKGAVCQVPGCDRSLHKLRDYYKRYKICPYHLELPCLVVEGQTIRFCQQCGRFQLLSDFEGDRRSCRRKLDKHNERRRKAEAEQKARMVDSGSDSPGASGRGTKAHRVSPYRGKGYASHASLMLGMGGSNGGDMADRLQQLAGEPGMQELPPGLLQTLRDPGMAGMDWMAAGSLTNLSMGAQGPPPMLPMPPPPPQQQQQQRSPMQQMLPPELLSLLPADVQQQVMQQGPGMLSSSGMMQMQQPRGPPQHPPQRPYEFSGYGPGRGPQQQQQQHHQQQQPPAPYGSPLPPGATAMLGPSLQQQLQLHQQRTHHLPPSLQSYAAGPPELPSNAIDSTGIFMHQLQQQGHHPQHQHRAPQQHLHMQQQQQQQYHPQQLPPPPQYHYQQQPQQQQAGPMGGIPLLRSEPLGQSQPQQVQPPRAEALAALTTADAAEKAALLVALARSVGVSQSELQMALMESSSDAAAAAGASGPGQAGRAGTAAVAASAAAAAPSGGMPQPSAAVKVEGAPGGSPVAASASPGQQQTHRAAAMAASGSLSLRKAGNSTEQPSVGAGDAGAPSLRSLDSGALPSSSDALPSVSSPKQPQQEQRHTGPPPPAAGSAAPPAGGLLAPAAAAPGSAAEALSRQPLDLEQLQGAVNGGGLSSGFSSDANLLLQLVAAVEAAQQQQQQSGHGKERMRNLSLKLFNVTPDRLPDNILAQLETWVVENQTLLEGSSRPGCVQMSVSALMTEAELLQLRGNFSHMVQQLASSGLGCGLQTGILGQLGSQAVLVDAGGSEVAVLDLESSGAAVPQICSVRPLVMTPGYNGPILVTGRNIGTPADTIFCSNGEWYPTTEVAGSGVLLPRCAASPASDSNWVVLRVPRLEEGCHRVEAQRGSFVSAPHSFLVLDDAAAVEELRQLEQAGSVVPDAAELLHRLGAVLRFGRGSGSGSRAPSQAVLRRVGAAAQELAATCILRGWAAVLRLVLPQVATACTAQAAVAGIEQHLCGIPLLHAAAVLGGAGVVEALGAWAAASDLTLSLDSRFGGGLTPLHVAVLLAEPVEVAVALTGLCPLEAQRQWAAPGVKHEGREAPLALACRLNKRGLLQALAGHGVLAAGAMLAVLRLGDAPAQVAASSAAAASGSGQAVLPVEAEESSTPRQQWEQPPVCPTIVTTSSETPQLEQSRRRRQQGRQQQQRQQCECCSGMGSDGCSAPESPGSVLGLRVDCWPAMAPASPAATPAPQGVSDCTAAHLQPKLQPLPQLDVPQQQQQQQKQPCSKEGGLLAAACEESAGSCFRNWQLSKLLQADSLACLLLALVLSAVLATSPEGLRQQVQGWLLGTMARAPLLLQPLLLLCPPARRAARQARGSWLVVLHLGMLGLQYWAALSRGSDWLASGTALATHPAGLVLLLAVFLLQLRFVLQVPALLLVYGINLVLLPVASLPPLSPAPRPFLPPLVFPQLL